MSFFRSNNPFFLPLSSKKAFGEHQRTDEHPITRYPMSCPWRSKWLNYFIWLYLLYLNPKVYSDTAIVSSFVQKKSGHVRKTLLFCTTYKNKDDNIHKNKIYQVIQKALQNFPILISSCDLNEWFFHVFQFLSVQSSKVYKLPKADFYA